MSAPKKNMRPIHSGEILREKLARANFGFKIATCGFLLATLARLPMTLVSGPPYPQWTLIVVVVMALGASVLAIAGVIIAVSAKFER